MLFRSRQPGFAFAAAERARTASARRTRPRRPARPHAASPAELEAHAAFVAANLVDPLWEAGDGA